MDWLLVLIVIVIVITLVILTVNLGSKHKYYKRLDKWRKKK